MNETFDKINPEDIYFHNNFFHRHKETVIEEIEYQEDRLKKLKASPFIEYCDDEIEDVERRLKFLRKIPVDNFQEWFNEKLIKIVESLRDL